jgi:deoxyribodipyrimidine photo-lyase
LKELGLPFYLVKGDPGVTVPALADRLSASLVVADFSPLRVGRRWREAVAAAPPTTAPKDAWAMHEVDAHNVVPVWEASDKQEYAARTIRPKINKRLAEFLTEFPSLAAIQAAAADAAAAAEAAGSTVEAVDAAAAGAGAANGRVVMPPPDDIDWPALIEASSVGAGAAVPEVWSVGRRKEPGERAARLALQAGAY